MLRILRPEDVHRFKNRRTKLSNSCTIALLEDRRLLAAHIVGDPTIYLTIQAAVDAAATRAIISVDAGTYPERVSINKSLTLLGARTGVDARSSLRAAGTNETILTGIALGGTYGRSGALLINSSDVTIDGFTIQGNTSTSTTTGAGIVIAPKMSGTHLFNNIVQKNVAGLFLANYNAADPAIIQHNLFRSNNNAGINGGRAIYSDSLISGGLVTNVTIDSNTFLQNYGGTGTTFLEAAISFESTIANSQSNIQVTNNVMDGNGKAVLFLNARNVLIRGNTVTYSRDFYSGALRFEGGDTDVTIQYNTIYRNPGSAVRIDEKGVNAPNTGFAINSNNFYGGDYQYGTRHGLIVAADQYDGATLDATNNWWGSATGPSGDGTGIGDGVQASGNPVVFSPWATSAIPIVEVPYQGPASSLDVPVEAENFDHGGEGVGDHNISTTNAGGQYRLSANVGIGYSSDVGGGYYVGWTTAGEWLDYTVSASVAGTYKVNFRVANGQATASKFHLVIDGKMATGPISVAPTGSWTTWKTIVATGINLTAGQHVVQLVMDTAGNLGAVANLNWFQFIGTALAPVPATPASLKAVAASPTQINLKWVNKSTSQASVTVDRSTDGINFAPRATLGPTTTTYVDSALTPGAIYYYRVRATNATGDSPASPVAACSTLRRATTATYLSDLSWISATSGWGTAQRDSSIIGSTLSVRGTTYLKGIGTHASSTITYALNSQYGGFSTDIGVDDEVGGRGAVDFEVIADGVVLYDSGVLTGKSALVHLSFNMIGVNQLTLVANPGIVGSVDFDHADWGNALLTGFTSASPIAN